jgi:hypothetical protein
MWHDRPACFNAEITCEARSFYVASIAKRSDGGWRARYRDAAGVELAKRGR